MRKILRKTASKALWFYIKTTIALKIGVLKVISKLIQTTKIIRHNIFQSL